MDQLHQRAIRLALKDAVKTLLWSLNQHTPSENKPDLWLFGSRRSGSTLLMQMIAVNSGIKFCNQPLSVRSAMPIDLELLQSFEIGIWTETPRDGAGEIKDYIQAIRAGRLHVSEPWRIFSPEFKFRSDRVLFKVTSAPALIDWIAEITPATSIVLTRHPISQAQSCIRNNWHPSVDAYLRSESYRKAYLSPAAAEQCADIQQSGSLLQRHVLAWCCENAPLLRHVRRDPESLFVPYEDLVIDVANVINELSETLGLDQLERMKQVARQPSLSSGHSLSQIRDAIRDGRKNDLLSGWRARIDADEAKAAMEILKLFELDTYSYDADQCLEPRRTAPKPMQHTENATARRQATQGAGV